MGVFCCNKKPSVWGLSVTSSRNFPRKFGRGRRLPWLIRLQVMMKYRNTRFLIWKAREFLCTVAKHGSDMTLSFALLLSSRWLLSRCNWCSRWCDLRPPGERPEMFNVHLQDLPLRLASFGFALFPWHKCQGLYFYVVSLVESFTSSWIKQVQLAWILGCTWAAGGPTLLLLLPPQHLFRTFSMLSISISAWSASRASAHTKDQLGLQVLQKAWGHGILAKTKKCFEVSFLTMLEVQICLALTRSCSTVEVLFDLLLRWAMLLLSSLSTSMLKLNGMHCRS